MITGAGCTTTIVLACVAFGAVPLAACTVKPNDPAELGVPLMMPLVEFKVRPGGVVPLITVQVIGVVPAAVKVWL